MTTQPFYKEEEIVQLIPQRAPIVMVDAFYGIQDGCSRSGLTVKADNLFCQDGYLQEPGLIEHIAQSAAARIGYLCRTEGKPVPLGFIGSVDKLSIYRLPETGEQVMTRITVVQEVGDITLIEAHVTAGDVCLAEGRMKIFLQKE